MLQIFLDKFRGNVGFHKSETTTLAALLYLVIIGLVQKSWSDEQLCQDHRYYQLVFLGLSSAANILVTKLTFVLCLIANAFSGMDGDLFVHDRVLTKNILSGFAWIICELLSY
jgi:hypothetical protein